jgi:pyruvate carboxylase subunit B
MVLGYFGKTPVPPDPGIVAIAQQQLELPPTTRTVLEINDADPRKSLDFYRQMLRGRGLPETEENIFIVAACGDKGLLFLEGKATLGVRKQEKAVEKPPAKEPDTRIARREACTVTVDGHPYEIRFEGETAIVNGHAYAFSLQEGAPVASPAPTVAGAEIRAPVPGLVLRILATPGQRVQAGQDLLILEAMKMEIPIKAAADGVLMSLDVRQAQKVNTGDLLARLS